MKNEDTSQVFIEDKSKDKIDIAFDLMGGFGRIQKISWILNTLCQAGPAFFLSAFVFLEKQPKYICK